LFVVAARCDKEFAPYHLSMNATPAQLTDDALLAEVKRLTRCERATTATLIAHLAEVDARELFRAEGCSTMFSYCTEVLRLSEHATFLRLRAARAAQQHPEILAELSSGALNLSSIKLIEPHLTRENEAELLDVARHKSKREVERLIRDRYPLPEVPSTVRKLPMAAHAAQGAGANPAPSAGLGAATLEVMCEPVARVRAPRPNVIAPLAPERYRVQFTASQALHDNLRRAQDLLRHRIPNGDVSQVFEFALTALVEKLEKQKLAATDRPRASRRPAPGSRTVPAEVRRAVWKRDGGRCAFIGKNERHCTETGFLEFHHVVAFAHGGEATIENIALRCRAHNQHEALLDFGPRDLPVVRESCALWGEFGPESHAPG
jgi:hypothetical protein